MLEDLVNNKKIRASATIGFWPCNSEGDDIRIFDEETKESLGYL